MNSIQFLRFKKDLGSFTNQPDEKQSKLSPNPDSDMLFRTVELLPFGQEAAEINQKRNVLVLAPMNGKLHLLPLTA